MSEILLYAISIMYSPGPVNLLGLNQGIQKQTRTSIGFFSGVGTAMFLLLLITGYAGASLIKPEWLFFIAIPGCLYIIYLAVKIFRASVSLSDPCMGAKTLGFRDGLIMQLLNPKGVIAVVPIATIQFPAAGISGWSVLLCSAGLSILAFGAPFSYAAGGSLLGRKINSSNIFCLINRLLAAMLVFVALRLGYAQVHSFFTLVL